MPLTSERCALCIPNGLFRHVIAKNNRYDFPFPGDEFQIRGRATLLGKKIDFVYFGK